MAASAVNDCIREIMAAVRRQHEAAEWIDLGQTPTRVDGDTFTVSGDYTGTYLAGRGVRMTGSATAYGVVSSSSYSSPNTTVNLTASVVPATLSTVAVSVVSGLGAVSGTTGTFSGTVTASAFSGAGSALTSLNASNISSGTLADGRLSSNVPLKDAANTFTESQQVTRSGTAGVTLTDNSTSVATFLRAGSSVGYLGTSTNHAFEVYTNNALRGAISAAGNWTINAPGSGTALDVTAVTGAVGVQINGASSDIARLVLRDGNTGNREWGLLAGFSAAGNFSIYDYTRAAEPFRINSTGNVTINAASSGYELAVTGEINATVGIYVNGVLVTLADGTNFPATLPASSGANLTALNASNVSSGTLANARLPSTINVTTLQQGSVGVQSLPAVTSTSTTLVKGQAHYITAGATLPALAAGEWISLINNSGSAITITENSGDTTYWTTSAASISTVTLAARGRLFAEGVGSNVVYVSGDITGSS